MLVLVIGVLLACASAAHGRARSSSFSTSSEVAKTEGLAAFPAPVVLTARSAARPSAAGAHRSRPARRRKDISKIFASRTPTPRSYMRTLTLARWHSVAEWMALVAIVTPESHFDPCAVYPSRHDCGYSGPSSCGIPQAQPCPVLWRGRLASTWRAQVRWILDYVGRRYGDPFRALAFRRANGWY